MDETQSLCKRKQDGNKSTFVLTKPQERIKRYHSSAKHEICFFTDFTNWYEYYRITQCAKDPDSAGKSMETTFSTLVCPQH